MNIQNHELSIPLVEIANVAQSRTMGIIPNGLTVETTSSAEKFVVQGAGDWSQTILQAKSTKP
jgi:hypothetical protein